MITDEKQREFWTVENLSKLSHQRLERVTRRLSNTLALTRILLGRCLLAIERTEGLSGNNSCIRGADPSPVAALRFPYILPICAVRRALPQGRLSARNATLNP